MNDTFYGFFYSLDEFFDKTNSEKNIDFWGMTKHPAGTIDDVQSIPPHIQSYFILVKSKMLHNDNFLDFWNKLDYPLSHEEAIVNFEVEFTAFFQKKGFKGEAYCDIASIEIAEQYNINPYMKYPYELIKYLGCPILKRKSCQAENANVWKAIEYIKENSLYEFDLMLQQILLYHKNGIIPSYFNLYKMEKFLQKYKKIYIFGKGKYGIAISNYLTIRNMLIVKFILSKKDSLIDEDVIELSEFVNEKEIGIVVALKQEYTMQVLEKLLEKVSMEQLFLDNDIGK